MGIMKKNENRIAALMLLIYSIAVKFFTTIYSMQFNQYVIHGDGGCFVAIGREILKGKVLYKDIFDHKTPYIYLINGLASLVNYNIGLFIVEVVVLFTILYFMYKILLLVLQNQKMKNDIALTKNQCYIVALIGIFIMGIILNDFDITGGYYRTEPYVVLFVVPAVYLIAEYYYGNIDISEMPKHMFIIGILAGLAFMINLKGIILFVPLVLPLLYDFIKQKCWIGVLKTFCLGLLGVAVAIIPYVVYMIVTDSVRDMIFAVWDTNLAYANDYMVYEATPQGFFQTLSTKQGMIAMVISFTMKYPYVMLMIGLSIVILFALNYNSSFKFVICLQIIILFITIFKVGRPHIYYLYTFSPYLIAIYLLIVKIFVNHCFIWFKNIKQKALKYFIIVLVLVFSIVTCFVRNYKSVNEQAKLCQHDAEHFRDIVSKYDDDFSKLNIFAFGFYPEAYLWLDADIKYKYFVRPFMTYNSFRVGIDEQVKYINSLEPDIFCIRSFEFVPKELERQVLFVLNYYYDLLGETEKFYVYGKKRSQ